MFSACESDRDSNPTIQQPTTFVLNEPAYAGEAIDLANTSAVQFTCSQPDYGYTASVTYKVQVSATDKYEVSADNVEEGTTPDYAELDDAFSTCQISANPAQFAKAVQQVTRTPEEQIPAEEEIYVRLTATVGSYTIASNSVKMKIVPYYVELKDATPEVWYLIGAVIADGKWTNSAQAIGTSMIPMFTQKDYEYDKKTGLGIIEYTGYIDAGAGKFKIVRTPGDWDNIVCCAGTWEGDTYKCFIRGKDGTDDPGDIDLGESGYYTITIDTKAQTCQIKKAAMEDVNVYESMSLPGSYNEWDTSAAMTPVETVEGAENHIWTADVTVTDGEMKFNNGDSWWGSKNFPYGYASTDEGGNIPVKAGSYKVFFNDLTGAFFFHEAAE